MIVCAAKTKVTIYMATFEPLLAGPTFARFEFKGPFAEPNWRLDERHVRITI